MRVTFARDRRRSAATTWSSWHRRGPRSRAGRSARIRARSSSRRRGCERRSIGPTARVTFADSAGGSCSRNHRRGHHLTPAVVQGEATLQVQQTWQAKDDESLYGLGQRQEGKLDIKGYDFDPLAAQHRRPRPVARVEPRLRHPLGQHGAVEVRRHRAVRDRFRPSALVDVSKQTPAVRGLGRHSVVAPVTGDYQFQTYSNGSTQRVARRHAADRSLQAELGHRVRPVQGPARRRASAIRSRSPTAAARRSAVAGRRRRRARRRHCGRKSATASTTTSSTVRRSTR